MKARAPYVELRAHTAFSFGDGAVTPEKLVQRAVELGYSSLGITDTADFGGIVRAKVEAEQHGLHLIVGAELRVDGYPMAFLVRTEEGCRNLAALITQSRVGALRTWSVTSDSTYARGFPNISWEQVVKHNAGLHMLTGPASGLLATLVRQGDEHKAEQLLHQWKKIFQYRFAVEVQNHSTGGVEGAVNGALVSLAERTHTPWVVTNDPRYIDDDSRLVHDILTALRYGLTLDEAANRGVLHPNSTWRLRSPAEMVAEWGEYDAGLRESVRIAEQCDFDVQWLRPPLPQFESDDGLNPKEALRKHVTAGALKRWGATLSPRHTKQLEHELTIIERLGFSGFFLVMWDAVRYARDTLNILCQGRGSAANSAVAYCLEITAVDPIHNNLLFERFLSDVRVEPKSLSRGDRSERTDGSVMQRPKHTEAPDIDVDIEHDQREQVLDYIYKKYERDQAAITCIVQTYGAPNAILDTMRALGYLAELGFKLSKRLRRYNPRQGAAVLEDTLAAQFDFDVSDARGRAVLRAMCAFDGLPRLRSTHVGGFVLSNDTLGNYLPIESTTMGRTIIQFDKDDLDVIGVPKFDFLGLGALALVRHAFQSIEKRTGKAYELYTIPDDDKATFEMISEGDTLGTFQIESRAQIASILHTRPERMYDIVVQIALVRPGPIQGEFVRPYTRRRRGQEDSVYIHSALRPILERTQGIPIFQEQAMKISTDLGGFTNAKADNLRRTMGNLKKSDRLNLALEELKQCMIDNTLLNPRMTPEIAERIGRDLSTFANYGFPESHAWSFAFIAYATSYLKCHYPADFYLGVLNAQPMGFYPVSTLIHDAQRHGVKVLPPCVRDGHAVCDVVSLETTFKKKESRQGIREGVKEQSNSHALRIGWRHIRGISTHTLTRLTETRQAAPFTSIADVVQRLSMKRSEVLQLSRSGAFGVWEPDRRKAAWEALRAVSDRLSLAPTHLQEYNPRPLTKRELTFLDYHTTGMCLSGHPVEHLRDRLYRVGAVDSRFIKSSRAGESVIVGGLVTVRQRPETAKGTIFLLIEDEFGLFNVIVSPDVIERYVEAVKFSQFVVIQGRVQRNEQTVNVIAKRVIALKVKESLSYQTHNFR